MRKYLLEDLVGMALRKDPRTIKDDAYLLAWVWTKEDIEHEASPQFNEKLGKLYTFLLKHAQPESVVRLKRKILNKDPVLEERYEDTESLRREVLEGQAPLIDLKELGRQRLAEIKGKLK